MWPWWKLWGPEWALPRLPAVAGLCSSTPKAVPMFLWVQWGLLGKCGVWPNNGKVSIRIRCLHSGCCIAAEVEPSLFESESVDKLRGSCCHVWLLSCSSWVYASSSRPEYVCVLMQVKLVQHTYSCLFGTFLCNSGKERVDRHIHERTCSVWSLLRPANRTLRNMLYSSHSETVSPLPVPVQPSPGEEVI